jgi:hypothetical protein
MRKRLKLTGFKVEAMVLRNLNKQLRRSKRSKEQSKFKEDGLYRKEALFQYKYLSSRGEKDLLY